MGSWWQKLIYVAVIILAVVFLGMKIAAWVKFMTI